MTADDLRHRVARRVGYFAAGLFVLCVVAFLSVGIRTALRARRLREDICKLQLGASTFDEVSRIFPRYTGYVGSHDAIPPSCSSEGCYYLLYVENPILRVIPIFPRTAFFATVRISGNALEDRSVGIEQGRGQHYREAFVHQGANSHFKEDTRIIDEMPRKGASVSFENSARFVQLAREMQLACLVLPGIWSELDDMLPYLKGKRRIRGADGR